MKPTDVQCLEDLLSDVDRMEETVDEIQDEDLQMAARCALEDIEDRLSGLLRRHRPRPEAPITLQQETRNP